MRELALIVMHTMFSCKIPSYVSCEEQVRQHRSSQHAARNRNNESQHGCVPTMCPGMHVWNAGQARLKQFGCSRTSAGDLAGRREISASWAIGGDTHKA